MNKIDRAILAFAATALAENANAGAIARALRAHGLTRCNITHLDEYDIDQLIKLNNFEGTEFEIK